MSLDRGKTDPDLGLEIQTHLTELGIETPVVENSYSPATQIAKITGHMSEVMRLMGMDLSDDSMSESPSRVAKMYVKELFYGLDPDNFPKCTVVENKMQYDEMVMEKGITVSSCCEHHFQTISGQAIVSYIPNEKVLGLSKLNRIVDYFSRRPQVQERLTGQIFHALQYVLETDNVAVLIDAEHGCVKNRGIQDQNSHTITSKLGGSFKDDPATRAEFMSLAKGE